MKIFLAGEVLQGGWISVWILVFFRAYKRGYKFIWNDRVAGSIDIEADDIPRF